MVFCRKLARNVMDQLKSELRETITELNRKFNKKIKEHSNRIEWQQDQLNHQSVIIEELSWQLRDLRDSLRKCNEQISETQSKYCIECAKNRMKLNIQTTNSNNTKQSDHVAAEISPIYESINFDAVVQSDGDSCNKMNKLKRQDAIDGNKRNSGYCHRDVKDFLERCIPPPPNEPPPPSDEDFEISPLEFSSETLEKLNTLYSLYKGSTSSSRSITNENVESADVEYRMPEFNDCSARLLRDSNKAVCSLVSNIEGDYLALSELSECDDDSLEASNKSVDKIPKNDKGECQNDKEKAVTQNEEVYYI